MKVLCVQKNERKSGSYSLIPELKAFDERLYIIIFIFFLHHSVVHCSLCALQYGVFPSFLKYYRCSLLWKFIVYGCGCVFGLVVVSNELMSYLTLF